MHHHDSASDPVLDRDRIEALSERLWDTPSPTPGILWHLEGWRGPADCVVGLRASDALESPLRDSLRALCQARVDAVLLEQSALDDRPSRSSGIEASGALATALGAWRRERLGRPNPPVTAVLSPSGEIDLDLPIFHDPGRVVVLVGGDPWALEGPAAERGVEVVGLAEPSVAQAIAWLRREFGAASQLLEGSTGLAWPVVDEVVLSLCEAPQIPAAAEAAWLIPWADLRLGGEALRERWGAGDPEFDWSHHHGRR